MVSHDFVWLREPVYDPPMSLCPYGVCDRAVTRVSPHSGMVQQDFVWLRVRGRDGERQLRKKLRVPLRQLATMDLANFRLFLVSGGYSFVTVCGRVTGGSREGY